MLGVELFSGAGGLSLGAMWSGVNVVLAIEKDVYSAQTYSFNHPKVKLVNKDIREVNLPRFRKRRKPLILFGGAPCQGFSTSNQRTRTSANPSNWLYKEFLRFANQLRPDWVVFENVKGIVETEGGKFLGRILSQLDDLGYLLSYDVINANDFGVPQNRSRLFIVGSRNGEKIELPKPKTMSKVTVHDAISDLPLLDNGASQNFLSYRSRPYSNYARQMRGNLKNCPNHLVTGNAPYIIERYKHIPQGGNWENIPPDLMGNYADCTRCHTRIYYRLKDSEPAVVIGNFRKNMLIHPVQNRGLSVREAARLQSFPDNYEFKGSIGFQQQQVGNAVPPLLAKAVFDRIPK
ncbi:MAG: DNA cytosine methyltransferase [Nitrospinae bacterium]|nr:DNA cytosine methyltransferase [Nitrospinota bacterium]